MKLSLVPLMLVLLGIGVFGVTPTNLSITINDGDAYTNNAILSLALDADDANQMNFSCDDTTWDENKWEDFNSMKSLNLNDYSFAGCTTSEGTKTVYFAAKSSDGNVSDSNASDSIVLDQSGPDFSNASPEDGGKTGNEMQVISVEVSDALSDVNSELVGMEVNAVDYNAELSELSFSAGVLSFTPSSALPEGTNNVKAYATDVVGNYSELEWSFTLDMTAPDSVTGITVTDLETGYSATLSWDASSAGDLNHYNVYYSETQVNASTLNPNKTATGTSTTVEDLQYGHTYYFAVTAVDDIGNEDNNVLLDFALTVEDTTVPAEVTSLTATDLGNGAGVLLDWNASSSPDAAYYYVFVDENPLNLADVNIVDANANVGSGTLNYTVSGLTLGTTYSFGVVAVDRAWLYDSSPPLADATPTDSVGPANVSISIESGAQYATSADIALSINAEDYSDMNMQFSCNESDWTTAETYSSSKGFNLTSQVGAGCSSSEGDKTVHLKVCDSNGNCSTASDSIFLDLKNPSFSEDPNVSVSGDDVTVTWNAASDDSPSSGIEKYYVSKDNGGSWVDKGTGTSHTFSDLSDGSYDFCVKAYDNAGNEGDKRCKSATVSTDNGNGGGGGGDECSAVINITAPRYARAGEVEFSFTSSEILSNVRLRVYVPSTETTAGGYKTVYSASGSSSGSGTYDFPEGISKSGQYVYVNGTDPNGQLCNERKSYSIDSIVPEVSLVRPDSDGVFGEENKGKVLAEATDEGTFIDKVFFEYRKKGDSAWAEIAALSVAASGNVFETEWNKNELVVGDYEFRVRAVDKAGNEAIETIEFSVGVGEGQPLEPDELVQAKADKEMAEGTLNELKKQLVIFSDETNAKWNEIESKLSEAEGLCSEGKETECIDLAKKVSELSSEISSTISVTIENSRLIEFREKEVRGMVALAGLSGALLDEATALEEKNPASRTLKLLKVTQGSETFYQLIVEVRVENNNGEELTAQVLEVIPKEFAKNADSIISLWGFETVRDDPIIKFSVLVPANGSAEVVYALNRKLTEEEGSKLMETASLEKFSHAPVLLKENTKVAERDFAQFPATGFGSLLGGLAGILPTAIVVIIVIVVALLIVSRRQQSRGNGLGNRGLGALTKNMEKEGLIGRISGKFKGNKEKPQGSKWAYKE